MRKQEWRDRVIFPTQKVRQLGSGRAGINHMGFSDFKFSTTPKTGESPGVFQKGTRKICGSQGVLRAVTRDAVFTEGENILSVSARHSDVPKPL